MILIGLLAGTTQAQTNVRLKEYNLGKMTPAIEGYDPVAYFTQKKAVKGNKAFFAIHAGVLYHFSSEENKRLFLTQPASYEPQYGGWCAYAMGAKGEKVAIDPETFKITNGRLFLFYNKFFTNTLTSWNKDETALATSADVAWSKYFTK